VHCCLITIIYPTLCLITSKLDSDSVQTITSGQMLVLASGILAFGIAQTLYVLAFGFKSRNMHTLAMSAAVGLLFKQVISKISYDGPLKAVGSIYVIFLVMMMWRGLDAASTWESCTGLERTMAITGSLLFVFSDFMIMYQSVHKFKYHEAIIMSTYYTAQYCLGRWALEKDGRSTTGKNKTE